MDLRKDPDQSQEPSQDLRSHFLITSYSFSRISFKIVKNRVAIADLRQE
jgi:hypothetical protein